MTEKNLVSVIIPCFNDGLYLDEAVNSILNQTYQDFEIIIVNDGSTDTFTLEKLRSFDSRPGIKVIHQENKGPVEARNNAISISKGEYILPLDADDYFDRTYLQKATDILKKDGKAGVVTCYIKCFGDSDAVYRPAGGNVANFLLKPNACGNSLYRKACWDAAGGYNPLMNEGYEDWDLWIGITKNGWNVKVIPEELFHYRRLNTKSRDVRAEKKRPELIRQMAIHHEEVYKGHVIDYMYHKELEIQNIHIQNEEKMNGIYSSLPYKIGKNLSNPLNIIKKLFWRRSPDRLNED